MAISSVPSGCVDRLCAGQVITSLSVAIKELIENALDAGCRSLEITFRDYGIESFSVVDDGCGIAEEDLQNIARKHFTSKISEFEDLQSVQSLGFRGEALFSLCTSSQQMMLTSRNSSASLASRVNFNEHGERSFAGKIARSVGTTVFVERMFHRYPVRRQEFEKNGKGQFSSTLEMLYAYALSFSNVRFTCINILKSGTKNTTFATSGCGNAFSCAKEIFGAIRMRTFTEFLFTVSVGEAIEFRGLYSSEQSFGRDSMVFVNRRPCDFKRIPKAISETYQQQFVPKGRVFSVVFIEVPAKYLDVNVTPDKRTIYVKGENQILSAMCDEFRKIFSQQQSQQSSSSPITSLPKLSQAFSKPDPPVLQNSPLRESFVPLKQKEVDQSIPIRLDRKIELTVRPTKQAKIDETANPTAERDLPAPTKPLLLQTPPISSPTPASPDTISLPLVTLCKEDFLKMKVVGQFNRGFIVISLRRETATEIFIVDQHAADEKYNYERLNSGIRIASQRLVVPIPLELAPSDEIFAQEHATEIRRRGFDFAVDDAKAPGRRLSLIATASVEELITFGADGTLPLHFLSVEFTQILHLMQSSFTDDFRRILMPKITEMHASKACRMSIMIGDALSRERMETILKNLASLEQPWVIFFALTRVELPTRSPNN